MNEKLYQKLKNGFSSSIETEKNKFASEKTKRAFPKYPPRSNMGECPPLYGKIGVIFVYNEAAMSQ